MNLNGVAKLALDFNAPFSYLLLPICLAIILSNVRHLYGDAVLGLFFLSFSAYILFSIVSAGLGITRLPADDFLGHLRKYLPTIIMVAAVYLAVRSALHAGRFFPYLRILFYCSLLTSIITAFSEELGLAQNYFDNVSYDIQNGFRDGGLFINPNQAGFHSNLTLVVACFLFVRDPSKIISLISLLSLPVIIYSVIVTFSKSAMLTTTVIMVLFLLFCAGSLIRHYRYHGRIWLMMSLLVISVIYIASKGYDYADSLTPGQMDRISDMMLISQGVLTSKTTTLRSNAWQLGWDKIKARPFLGSGLGSFHSFDEIHGIGVHNVYLMIWGEAGFMPFFLMVATIMMLYAMTFHRFDDRAWIVLVSGLLLVTTVQLYGSGHTGLRNQEANGVIGLVLALLSGKSGKWS